MCDAEKFELQPVCEPNAEGMTPAITSCPLKANQTNITQATGRSLLALQTRQKMTNKLTLWESVSKTDPQYTKKGKKSGNAFTSISPMYQFKNATETFGMFGIGWGIKAESEKFSYETIGDTTLLNYDAVLFYKINSETGEYPIHSTMPQAYKTNNGYMKVDDDARKKVVTNALTKGLSMLGFNADIFMGEYDDQDYVAQVATEFGISKAEDKDDEAKAKRDELTEYVKKHLDCINNANSASEASGLFKSCIRHLDRQKNIGILRDIAERGLKAIHDAHESKKEALNEAV